MKTNYKLVAAVATVGTLLAGPANALLVTTDFNTSVFISVVERNNANQVVRNLTVDTGIRTLDVFAQTPWVSTASQSAEILDFLSSSEGRVFFNLGGALIDESFTSDFQGFITTTPQNQEGPGPEAFTPLGTGIGKIQAKIANANNGNLWNAAGIILSSGPSDAGWHVTNWNNDVGGALLPTNETLFGGTSPVTGWRTVGDDFIITRFDLGFLQSDALTGQFSLVPVPVPAAAWLLGSAVGVLAWRRRRAEAVAA